MNLEIIVSSLYLMTLPSERHPKKMQRESISFLEVCPKALIALFHCHVMQHCPALPSHLLSGPVLALHSLWCSAQFTSCPCCCATSFTGSCAPGNSSLASASVLHSRHIPPAAPTGQVQSFYKPHNIQVLEKNKESFCICSLLSFRFPL